MTWLRIHDGFTQNAKISQLTDAEFRVWIRLLCHCGSARDPSVDRAAKREVSGLTSARVRRFQQIGLLDEIGDEYEIHHWPQYMPKEEQNAARQAKWRSRARNAERNAEVTPDRNAPSNALPSRTRAGTRGVPSSPEDQNLSSVQPSTRDPASDWDGEDPDGLTEHDLSQNGLPSLEHVLKEIS